MATRRITVEVEVPEGSEWVADVVRDVAGRLVAYLLLEAKARKELSDEEIASMVREARRRVWERVKHEYTPSTSG